MEAKKSSDEVLRERFEERGWDEMYQSTRVNEKVSVEPLDLTEKEYQEYSRELASRAVSERDPNLCELYFETQRRAIYGNHYSPVQGLDSEEVQMWALGTGEKIENQGPRLR